MGDFIYTTVPGKIKGLLHKIRDVGVPSKVSQSWLKSVGYTSSNDGSLVGILKFIGLVDATAVPTARWKQFRGADYKQVLGHAIREGYSELFSVYPDANQRSQGDLEHVFSTNTSGGKQVVAKTISTFKALVDEAEFSGAPIVREVQIETPQVHEHLSRTERITSKGGNLPGLHIDIQIHISPESTPEQIDQIFSSMAKHLYGSQSSK